MGTWEIIAVALVAVFLFGKRLPDLCRSLAWTVQEYLCRVQQLVRLRDDRDWQKLFRMFRASLWSVAAFLVGVVLAWAAEYLP